MRVHHLASELEAVLYLAQDWNLNGLSLLCLILVTPLTNFMSPIVSFQFQRFNLRGNTGNVLKMKRYPVRI
jgi:hypothetical protein